MTPLRTRFAPVGVMLCARHAGGIRRVARGGKRHHVYFHCRARAQAGEGEADLN